MAWGWQSGLLYGLALACLAALEWSVFLLLARRRNSRGQGFSPLPPIETFFAAFFLTLLPIFQLLKGKNADLNWGNALKYAVICPACQP
jgi:hypothetical protein